MRESIGASFLLNFIIVFIFFVFAFLAASFSYYKAYRINNMILHAIEKYEGYNDYAIAEINTKITNMGYQRDHIKCPQNRYENNNKTVKGTLVNSKVDNDGYTPEGYCIYLYWNEKPNKRGDVYYGYGIVTYLRLEVPIFGAIIKMPVYSKTYNIYHWKEN